MLIDRFVFAEEPMESVTQAVKDKVPAAIGVPEIVPDCEFIASPLGRPPEANDQRKGAWPPIVAIGTE
jgi:hypothetical protein